jgi:hypothetical protein
MKFSVGDKVKFLNESGGGFISKIITPSLVHVSTSDGFDIPISTTELIKVEVKSASANFFDEDFGSQEKLSTEELEEIEADAKTTPLIRKKSDILKEGLSIAFIPQDQLRPLFGLVDIELINNSSFHILFALFRKDEDQFIGQDYDAIEPYSTFLLDSIDRDELGAWLEGNVQAMFFANSMPKLISPVNEFFKIKGSKLYQENNYKAIDILEKRAFVHQLNDLKYQTLISKTEETANIQSAELGRDIEQALGIKKSLIEGHKIGLLEAEIDLHISALDSDYQNLEKHEIMQAQLDYFEKTLEDAMIHQYKKLIYIHGIGNGSLKSELRRILKTYPDIQAKEAAFNSYGYGAIEVHIHYR